MYNRRTQSIWWAGATVLAALCLSGCSPTPDQGIWGDAESTNLPEGISAAGVVDGSVRSLGDDSSGRQYYLFKADESGQETICLVLSAQSVEQARACSTNLPVTLRFEDTRATVHPEPAPDGGDPGSTLSEYVSLTPPAGD